MPLKFISSRLCLGLIPGIVLGESLNLPVLCWISVLLIGLFALAWLRGKPGHYFGCMVFLCCLLLGGFTTALRKPGFRLNHYSNAISSPGPWHFKVLEELKSTAAYKRYRCEVLQVGDAPSTGELLVKIPRDSSSWTEGSRVTAYPEVYTVAAPQNPYQFNYARYLYLQGITHEAKVRKGILEVNPGNGGKAYARKIRADLRKILSDSGLKDAPLALLSAMLLGERDFLDQGTTDAFRDAGAIHILAISGLHIGILLVAFHFLLSPLLALPHGRHIRLFILLVVLWGYAYLTGLQPSACRAVSMWSFMAWTTVLGRRGRGMNSLSLSFLFLLLLADPYMLFQPGFQLSYAAVLAILHLHPILLSWIKPRGKVSRKLWEYVTVSISAQIGVLPFLLYYFHQFPLHFLMANLALIPFLATALCLGLFNALAGAVLALPALFTQILELLLVCILELVQLAASLEALIIRGISIDRVQFLLIMLMTLTLYGRKHNYLRTRALVFLSAILCLQLYSLRESLQEQPVFWILDESRTTVLLMINGSRSELWTSADPTARLYALRGFREHGKLKQLKRDSLQGKYRTSQHSLEVVTNATYTTGKASLLLMHNSPTINLDRILEQSRVRIVVADGSNAPYLLPHWERSCKNAGVRFHNTRTQGAFQFVP